MQRQEQEMRQQAQQMRVMAQRQEQIDRQRRANRMNLDLIHEQALDYVLNYFPFEDEFREAIQTSHQWGYEPGADCKLLSVKRWFNLGARIDISKFFGVEHGTKKRIVIGSDTPWTYWASRQLSIVISYVGGGFLSREQLMQRIKDKIKDPNVFR